MRKQFLLHRSEMPESVNPILQRNGDDGEGGCTHPSDNEPGPCPDCIDDGGIAG